MNDNKWISSKEKKPETPCICFTYTNDTTPTICYGIVTVKCNGKVMYFPDWLIRNPIEEGSLICVGNSISYWMSIPKHPEKGGLING
jgi:hypothetical protein